MLEDFRRLARYNRWANARLYETAFNMPDELYRADVGVFFKSIHGTFNHLLVADRVWMWRLTGVGDEIKQLDAILYDDLKALAAARVVEDERYLDFVEACDEEALQRAVWYRNRTGQPESQVLGDLLRHIFNHQTHHRGQVHACVSIVGEEPPPLDLLFFDRGFPAPDLAALARGDDARTRSEL